MPDVPRYASRSLPHYAHRPGRTPHPVTDPRGHSFGLAHPAPRPGAWTLPPGWRDCEPYLAGCDLFNLGYWWEAHEAWEEVWRSLHADAFAARFLRALIQVAAAAIQHEAGQLDGAARLLDRAAANLAPVLDTPLADAPFMGLDVREWFAQARRALAPPPPIVLAFD